uniref:THO complex subunit 1 n=1 Tax=Pseudo-nitzschia australis TaxID=44445 RepID=A0A7S4ANT1_9STRA|mmetsp:Transcript_14321/g.29186  ORF Transcript_14321/g.29186 Transcript_14321/m.29186 type:complete len:962 (-) Transcript_14321:484-3369(-)
MVDDQKSSFGSLLHHRYDIQLNQRPTVTEENKQLNRTIMTIEPTDAGYIDSIEDPFFKSVAKQVVDVKTNAESQDNTISDGEKVAYASRRLEDMEISVRRELLALLLLQGNRQETADGPGNDHSTANADTIGVFWKSSLDICHHLVHHALCSKASKSRTVSYENLAPCRRLPYILLSDCLDCLPSLEDAQHFWSNYVEPTLVNSLLFGDKFWCLLTEKNNSKKLTLPSSHLPFLKVTNQFLKRLEHASDNAVRVEWKGRILWALAKGFSIADKSSLKSWGNFHTTNETDFENKEEFKKSITVVVTPSARAIDYNLYEAFWSLQTDFANPNKINVGDFIKKLRLILEAMESAAAASGTTNTPNYDGNKVEDRGTTRNSTKYLTSSALLPSQIEDPAFRSSVVTQFLIVASHLGAESPPLKNALSSFLGRARKLLKNDRPQLHDILWESILVNGREDDWRTWKKQKCTVSAFAPNFKRSHQLVLDNGSIDEGKRQHKRSRLLSNEPLDKNGENSTVSEETVSSLSGKFLDNNDLVTVSKNLHDKIPTLEEHLEPYVEALDPESGIEDEYHPKNDSLFTWRAMRLYAKYQLPLMSQCRKPADLEKITRKWYRQSLGKDIPGELQPVEEFDDADDGKKKYGTTSAEMNDNDNHNDENKTDKDNMNTEMKDAKKEGAFEKDNQNINDENDAKMDDSNDSNATRTIEETPSMDNTDLSEADKEDKGRVKSDEEDSNPTKESLKKTESNMHTQSKNSKTDDVDENVRKTKIVEDSKPYSSVHSDTKKGNEDGEKSNDDQNRSNKNNNSNQGLEKRAPREKILPQNRGGGRRSDDGGRNSQEHGRRDDGGRNIQEQGRRDDDLAPRRRGDDIQQLRGRPGGESSYRGRSDGPPPRRGGGRYDDGYRGDNRGERFNGERGGRSVGRDNHRGGGDRGGGVGRDDLRGGERAGDRNRRNNETRPHGGGRRRR